MKDFEAIISSTDIGQLRVRKGHLETISRYNLFGRLFRHYHREEKDIEVLQKIQQILNDKGLNTVHNKFTHETFNVQFLTVGRVKALLKSEAIAVPWIQTTAEATSGASINLATRKEDLVKLQFGNTEFTVETKHAKNAPIFADVINETGTERPIPIPQSGPFVNEKIVLRALRYLIDPKKELAKKTITIERLQLIQLLDAWGVDLKHLTPLMSGQPDIHSPLECAQALDFYCSCQSLLAQIRPSDGNFFEPLLKDLLQIADLTTLTTQKARWLCEIYRTTDCGNLFEINTHGEFSLQLYQQDVTELKIHGLTKILRELPLLTLVIDNEKNMSIPGSFQLFVEEMANPLRYDMRVSHQSYVIDQCIMKLKRECELRFVSGSTLNGGIRLNHFLIDSNFNNLNVKTISIDTVLDPNCFEQLTSFILEQKDLREFKSNVPASVPGLTYFALTNQMEKIYFPVNGKRCWEVTILCNYIEQCGVLKLKSLDVNQLVSNIDASRLLNLLADKAHDLQELSISFLNISQNGACSIEGLTSLLLQCPQLTSLKISGANWLSTPDTSAALQQAMINHPNLRELVFTEGNCMVVANAVVARLKEGIQRSLEKLTLSQVNLSELLKVLGNDFGLRELYLKGSGNLWNPILLNEKRQNELEALIRIIELSSSDPEVTISREAAENLSTILRETNLPRLMDFIQSNPHLNIIKYDSEHFPKYIQDLIPERLD